MSNLLEETRDSLERVQTFDLGSLPQRDRLGEYDFEGAVEPASRVQNLFLQIPSNELHYFPENQLAAVKNQSDALFNLFKSVLDFSVDEGGVIGRRNGIIDQIDKAYQSHFGALWHHISYLSSRTQDFDALSREARAKITQIEDATNQQKEDLQKAVDDSRSILDEIRAVAAEQGVSQQAEFFKRLADDHDAQSEKWLFASIGMIVVSAIYAILGLFFHNFEWLVPSPDAPSVVGYQFVVSKILIFAVFAYGSYASVRNYFNHKHNSVINRQKQTALQTYKILAEAAHTSDNRDIVLSHAASCIFGLPDTGFTRGGDGGAPHTSMIEILRNTASTN